MNCHHHIIKVPRGCHSDARTGRLVIFWFIAYALAAAVMIVAFVWPFLWPSPANIILGAPLPNG